MQMQDTAGPSSGAVRSISEVRRNQVRQAQKIYHARKKEVLQNLEKRVHFLEQTVEEMSEAMIALNDTLTSSSAFRRQPYLVRRLETTLRHALSLASAVHPHSDNEDDPAIHSNASTAVPSGIITQQVGITGRPISPSRAGQHQLANFSPQPATQPPPRLSNLGFPLMSEGGIVLNNPIASRMFPFFAEWSTFALRLYWNTLILAYTALSEVDNSTLSPELFRYTLEHRPKETILKGLGNMLNYMAVTPERPDGTIVVTQRPFNYNGSSPLGDGDEARQLLEQFLTGCDGLQTAIAGNIAIGPEQGQRFLFADEVQSYMEERGCQLRQDSIIELPLAVSLDAPEQLPIQPVQTTMSDQNQPNEVLYGDKYFDPLNWHDSRVIFPEQEIGSVSSTHDADTVGPDQSTIQQNETRQGLLISMDELILHFSKISVCVGTGARYPARGIDATLNALAMNRLVY